VPARKEIGGEGRTQVPESVPKNGKGLKADRRMLIEMKEQKGNSVKSHDAPEFQVPVIGSMDPPQNSRRKKKERKNNTHPKILWQKQEKDCGENHSTQGYSQKPEIGPEGLFWQMDEKHEG